MHDAAGAKVAEMSKPPAGANLRRAFFFEDERGLSVETMNRQPKIVGGSTCQRSAQAFFDFIKSLVHVSFPNSKHAVAVLLYIVVLATIHSSLAILFGCECREAGRITVPVVTVKLNDQFCRRHECVDTPLAEHRTLAPVDDALRVEERVSGSLQFGLHLQAERFEDAFFVRRIAVAALARTVANTVRTSFRYRLRNPEILAAKFAVEEFSISSLPDVSARLGAELGFVVVGPCEDDPNRSLAGHTRTRLSCSAPDAHARLIAVDLVILPPMRLPLFFADGTDLFWPSSTFSRKYRSSRHQGLAASGTTSSWSSVVDHKEFAARFTSNLSGQRVCGAFAGSTAKSRSAFQVARDYGSTSFASTRRTCLGHNILNSPGTYPPRRARGDRGLHSSVVSALFNHKTPVRGKAVG